MHTKNLFSLVFSASRIVHRDFFSHDIDWATNYLILVLKADLWTTACINHIIHNQHLFREIGKTAISRFRIGNGEYIPVEGKGTVPIERLAG